MARKFGLPLSSEVPRLAKRYVDRALPQLVDERKYIASFSMNATNPTMWGHYAGAQSGFVVMYESENQAVHVQSPLPVLYGTRCKGDPETDIVEIGHDKDDHLELQNVVYGTKPPKVNAFHRLVHKFHYTEAEDHYDVPALIAGDAEEKKEEMIGLIKYSDWRYEREVRAFFPSRDVLSPDIRVLAISLKNFRGVIFGPRMSDQDKVRTVVCCRLMVESRDPSRSQDAFERIEIGFFEAKQAVDRLDFTICPVGILDGHCSGSRLPLKKLADVDPETRGRLQGLSEQIEKGHS